MSSKICKKKKSTPTVTASQVGYHIWNQELTRKEDMGKEGGREKRDDKRNGLGEKQHQKKEYPIQLS